MKVIKPSIPMRSEPNETSNLETECLFGETLKILDEHLDWNYCKLLTDNYYGWVQKRNLYKMKRSSHRIVSNRTFLFKKNDVKSGCLFYLPLGAQVCVKDFSKGWAKIYLPEILNQKFAYIPSKHIIKISDTIKDWVSVAESLIGTPYVWGGRDTMGIDCSALLQLSYQTYGQNIARNSNEQSLIKKNLISNKSFLQRGFVVFWKGHVGIMTDELNCIHANAFHMQVSKEPLVDIIARTKEDDPIIKIMNFN